jgi:deazaflavin-dependent oxidoreductase (nitroreductase family)
MSHSEALPRLYQHTFKDWRTAMSGTTQPHSRTEKAGAVPVGPSLFVRLVMRPMSKLLNPFVAALAGRRHFPLVAQIHHVGRRTGKPYVTSVGASIRDGTMLIPMTFGSGSDWTRNVRAAGHCSVRLNGVLYPVREPQFLDAANARPLIRAAFGPVERTMFKTLAIKQFMQLRLTSG